MRLAVCAEMVFRDLPITERVQRIAELGFEVEIWDWTRHDIDALAATGAMFSSMTGYVRGNLVDPSGADELLRTAGSRSRWPRARRPASQPARHRSRRHRAYRCVPGEA